MRLQDDFLQKGHELSTRGSTAVTGPDFKCSSHSRTEGAGITRSGALSVATHNTLLQGYSGWYQALVMMTYSVTLTIRPPVHRYRRRRGSDVTHAIRSAGSDPRRPSVPRRHRPLSPAWLSSVPPFIATITALNSPLSTHRRNVRTRRCRLPSSSSSSSAAPLARPSPIRRSPFAVLFSPSVCLFERRRVVETSRRRLALKRCTVCPSSPTPTPTHSLTHSPTHSRRTFLTP